MSAAIPTWSTWREAVGVETLPRHLRSTVRIALIVGTVLFAINQLDVVLYGDATMATWVKTIVTYLVPFVISNLGVLTATRRVAASGAPGPGSVIHARPLAIAALSLCVER
jgi:hypothetical protein